MSVYDITEETKNSDVIHFKLWLIQKLVPSYYDSDSALKEFKDISKVYQRPIIFFWHLYLFQTV